MSGQDNPELRDAPDSMGARIRAARERAGMNKNQLARALGTSWQHVDRWERDRTQPATDSIRRLAQVLNASVGELLGDPAEEAGPEAFVAFLDELAPDDLSDAERTWLRSAPVAVETASPESYIRLLGMLRGGPQRIPASEAPPPARTGRRAKVNMDDVIALAAKRREGQG